MASPDLKGCYARLERAREQILSFGEALVEWQATRPHTITVEQEAESGIRKYYFQSGQPPERLGIIAGEALHNIRASLDNLSCRLAERAGNVSAINKTYFPFAKKREYFETKGMQDKIRALSPRDREIICSLRPYGCEEGDQFLFEIHDLNRADKHVDLVSAGAVSAAQGLKMKAVDGTDGGWVRRVALFTDGWTRTDEPVLVLYFDADPDVDPGLKVAVNVSLSGCKSRPIEPATLTLEAMRNKVRGIIDLFDT